MRYITERLDTFGDAIWYFPGGVLAMLAVYFILTYGAGKRAKAASTEAPSNPQSQRLGCVWTLLCVYIVVWVFLILSA
ncbi:MAG: hypothetical protein ACTSUD_03530 [Alphaproteobacteria bacterium]